MRELDFARRADPRPELRPGPLSSFRRAFGRMFDGNLTGDTEEHERLWIQGMTDVLHPPPEGAEENELARTHRREADILRELASIPEPVVTRTVVEQDDFPCPDWPFVLARPVMKRDNGKGYSGLNRYSVWEGYRLGDWRDRLLAGVRVADRSARIRVSGTASVAAFRSFIAVGEEHDYDSRDRVSVDGRHFVATLTLSRPMRAEVQALIPEEENGQATHVLCVPVTDVLPARDIPLDSGEGFQSFPQARLREVVLADLSGEAPTFHRITEGD